MKYMNIIDEAKNLYKKRCTINECKIRIAFINKFGYKLDSLDIESFGSNVIYFNFDDFKIIGQIFSGGIFFVFRSENNFWSCEIENLEDLGKYICLNEK